MKSLKRAGLVNNGVLLIDQDDLKALLSGRRTDMLRLEKLEFQGMVIDVLDVKLSLARNDEGLVELKFHPINKEPKASKYLTDKEAEMLAKGKVANLQKSVFDDKGRKIEVLIEFDKETNEFVITDTERILAPDSINGIPLTAEQKERYRKGKEVATDDGTTIQYSANEKQGIRSDKLALIASILIDGGISYVMYKGLHALFGKKEQKQSGSNYNKALKDMSKAEAAEFAKKQQPSHAADEEYSETISR